MVHFAIWLSCNRSVVSMSMSVINVCRTPASMEDGACKNSSRPLAVNSCWKALHLRFFGKSWLHFCLLCIRHSKH